MSIPRPHASGDLQGKLIRLIQLARADDEPRSPSTVLVSWLDLLAGLTPIPIERLLVSATPPPESVSVMRIDGVWLDELRRGALTVYSCGMADEQLAQGLLSGLLSRSGEGAPNPAPTLAVITRSARFGSTTAPVVAAWRDAARTEVLTPLQVMRLAPDYLIVLFDETPADLEITEFSLRFGADPTKDPDKLPMREGDRGVLDIAALARRSGENEALSSAEIRAALLLPGETRALPTVVNPEPHQKDPA